VEMIPQTLEGIRAMGQEAGEGNTPKPQVRAAYQEG